MLTSQTKVFCPVDSELTEVLLLVGAVIVPFPANTLQAPVPAVGVAAAIVALFAQTV